MQKKKFKYIVFSALSSVILIVVVFFILNSQPDTKPLIKTIEISETSQNIDTIVNNQNSSSNTSMFNNNQPIDINTATKNELMQLEGIGEVMAQRIIDYRDNESYFYNINEIKNVKGIGDSIFEKIKDRIYVNIEKSSEKPKEVMSLTNNSSISTSNTSSSKSFTTNSQTTKITTTKQTTSDSKSTKATTSAVIFPIEINSASLEEFEALDGIGEELATRILQYRYDNYGFYTIEEIMNVRGIGPSTFEKIKNQIYVNTDGLPEKTTTTKVTTTQVTTETTRVTTKATTITTTQSEITTSKISIVNLNTADSRELETLPNITPELAKKIIDFRTTVLNGKFSSVYELLYVDGMTNNIFNGIFDYIEVR